MKLTSHLSDDRRLHVEARLRANLMAWLTTVRPDGRPDSVPVWFLLRDDETILVYSQPGKMKLRNVAPIGGVDVSSCAANAYDTVAAGTGLAMTPSCSGSDQKNAFQKDLGEDEIAYADRGSGRRSSVSVTSGGS